MRLQRYPDYQDSGAEWMGKVPKHWQTNTLKRLARLVTGVTPATDVAENYAEKGFPWIRPEDIDETGLPTFASKFLSDAGWAESRQISAGSTLICCIGTIGKVGVAGTLASTNQQITSAEFRENGRFFFHVMSAARSELENAATGNVLRILNSERLGSIRLPCPPLDEQSAIAAFLDRETAKIDALIAEQERLLQLLAEKRQAVISHAVTKGLSPDAPMKDSGVAWLGEVPAHWDVVPLKHLVSMRSGGTPSKDNLDFWDGDVPWASSRDLKAESIDDTFLHISRSALEAGVASLVPKGSILVVVRGMILARLFPVVEALVPVSINQDLKAVLPGDRIEQSYLAWLLRGSAAESLQRLDEAGHGTKALRMEAWTSMLLPVPPRREQIQIAGFIKQRTREIDDLSIEVEKGIALLSERRSALIAAAVTGQIDVREAA